MPLASLTSFPCGFTVFSRCFLGVFDCAFFSSSVVHFFGALLAGRPLSGVWSRWAAEVLTQGTQKKQSMSKTPKKNTSKNMGKTQCEKSRVQCKTCVVRYKKKTFLSEGMCQCFGIARLFFRQTHLKADAQYNRKRGAHTDGVEGKKRKFLVVRVLLRPACSERQKFGPRPGVHASLQVQN